MMAGMVIGGVFFNFVKAASSFARSGEPGA
jgi:hypothetical protein